VTYGLGDAWHQWLAGERVESAVYGVKAAWWARGGKSLEFIAALSILADVLGPERLRRFGKSLHGVFSQEAARTLLVGTFRWLVLFVRSSVYTFAHDKRRADAAGEEAWKYTAPSLLNFVLGVIPAVATWRSVRSDPYPMDVVGALLLSALAGGLAMMTLAPLVTVVTLVGLSVSGMLCDVLVIRPAAWVLEREGVERRIKIIAAVLLVVGFQFDLLFTP
jgi:hypothetical protein